MSAGRKWLIVLIAALAIAGAISLLASSDPDGLERVAESLGVEEKDNFPEASAAPFAGYTTPFLGDSPLSVSFAGIAGTLITFIVVFAIFKAGGRWRSRR